MPTDDAPRLPLLTDRDGIPTDHRDAYDRIAASRGSVRGPFGALMHSPPVADRVAHLGAYLRFEGVLPDPLRELAILATARAWDCAYEWAVHADLAVDAGVAEPAIDAVATGDTPADLDPDAAATLRYCRELLDAGTVTDDTFDAARTALGDRGLVELTATVGYYTLLAFVLNACGVTPAGHDALPWT